MSGTPYRIKRGDLVKVIWKDACEGPVEQELSGQGKTRLRGSISSSIASIGRYLRTFNGYLILDDVIYEEANGRLLFEKQAEGKWLSIPIGVIDHVTPVGEISGPLLREAKRRRTVFRQLKFIPRIKKTSTGEVSRMLYVA